MTIRRVREYVLCTKILLFSLANNLRHLHLLRSNREKSLSYLPKNDHP